MEEDYELHIRNKALLSHSNGKNAFQVAEYLAGEIITMRRLEGLKDTVKKVLDKLSEEERAIIETRYFGKRNKLRDFLKKREGTSKDSLTERTFYRRHTVVGEKVGRMLRLAGLTEEKYLREYAQTEIFQKVRRALEKYRQSRL